MQRHKSVSVNYLTMSNSNFNYSIDPKGLTKEIHEITWDLPGNLDELETNSEGFSSENSKELHSTVDTRIQLKIKAFAGDDSFIEIYYKASKPLIVKYKIAIPGYNLNFKKTPYNKIPSQTWQFIAQSRYSLPFTLIFRFTINIAATNADDFNCQGTQFSEHFEILLNNAIFSDITMKSADEQVFQVHKVVLACRSAVLKAHFEHNTSECFTSVIESPFDADVLSEVLRFIYTDKVPRVNEIPEELLAAAEYYQLSGLKAQCERALHKKLTINNATETLQLAALHNADTLKELTLAFIGDGNIQSIIKTENWAKFESLDLIKQILEIIIETTCKTYFP